MTRNTRRIVRSAALFFVLVIVPAWPIRQVREQASAVLIGALNPLLGQMSFGRGGRAQLRHAQVREVRRPGENVSSDAELALGVDGYPQKFPVGLNLRRDFYLPLLIFAAAVLAAPVRGTRRLAALVLGFPVAFYLCLGSLYLTVCWLFAHQAPIVYPLSAAELKLLDTVISTLVMPPTLRFFAPLATGVGMLALLSGARDGEPRTGDAGRAGVPSQS